MKAFFVGLMFLFAVVLLAGVGLLLFPLLVMLGLILRLVVAIALVILAVWLLGKFIIFVWGKLSK